MSSAYTFEEVHVAQFASARCCKQKVAIRIMSPSVEKKEEKKKEKMAVFRIVDFVPIVDEIIKMNPQPYSCAILF